MDSKNIKYITLTILLLILSVLGIYSIFKINPSPLSIFLPTPEIEVPKGPSFKTEPQEIKTLEIKTPEINTATEASVTSKISPTPTPTKTPTKIPTKIPTPQSNPSISNTSTFTNTENNFSINYLSNRKVYPSTEEFGNRYTFYNTLGNFAVHVTQGDNWSWTNTGRNFSSVFSIAGQDTYRYDTDTQTIVDIQSKTKNYTLQCIHNNQDGLKVECENFIKSFQFLEPDSNQDFETDSNSDSE